MKTEPTTAAQPIQWNDWIENWKGENPGQAAPPDLPGADGWFIASDGRAYPPDTPLNNIPAFRPSTLDPNEPPRATIYLVNGVDTATGASNGDGEAAMCQQLANRTGCSVIGIHNETEGRFPDLVQSMGDKANQTLHELGISYSNAATETVETVVMQGAQNGVPVYLAGHSQGGLILSSALTQAESDLRASGVVNPAAELSNVHVLGVEAAAWTWPQGPQIDNIVNTADPVPVLLGQGGFDVARLVQDTVLGTLLSRAVPQLPPDSPMFNTISGTVAQAVNTGDLSGPRTSDVSISENDTVHFYDIPLPYPDGKFLSHDFGLALDYGLSDETLNHFLSENGTHTAYDAEGRVTSVTDQYGITKTFGTHGSLASITDSAGNTTTYDGNDRSVTTNPNGTVLSRVDAAGNSTTYDSAGTSVTTDAAGNVTDVVLGQAASISGTANGGTPTLADPGSAQTPTTTLLQGHVDDVAAPAGNGDSSPDAGGSAHVAGGGSGAPVGTQLTGDSAVLAPESDAGSDPSSSDAPGPDSLTTIHETLPDPDAPDSLTTIHGILPDDASATDGSSPTPGPIDWLNPGAENDPLFTDTVTNDQGDGQQSGPGMVDDQDSAFGTPVDSSSSTDSGNSTDIGEPDAQLTTEVNWGAGTLTDSPSSTDGDDQADDSTTLATPRTIDWLNPGAENDPLFHDTDSQGDGDQPSGPGTVDDQDNAFGAAVDSSSSTDTDGPTDPSDPDDAELSTDIALLPNSATDSPSSTDGDDQADDSTTLATPGTIDWLNPGAENEPLFNDTD